MNHLLNWLRYNPEYCDLPFPEGELTEKNLLRVTLKNLFKMANEKNPSDIDVIVGLGVIEFGKPNYYMAAHYFGQAVNLNPTDYNLWNKYGAGLANYLDTSHALEIYDKALSIRPNLVRTWANVGIAY